MKTRGVGAALVLIVMVLGAGPAFAQWQEADTAHFRFLFEPRDRAYVDQLLTFCEEVYARVTGFFGSYPPVVPCVVRGRRDDANGATFTLPSRIDLYVKAPTDFALGTRHSVYLRVLLTHELTHFVQQGIDAGIFGALSHVFGTDTRAAGLYLLPDWAVEGTAVYNETRFTDGGRGRDPLFEIYLKAAAEENRFFSLGQAGYSSSVPPAGRQYIAGDALITWLEDSYGPGTVRRILDAYLPFPFLGPWDAISRVTGKPADAVYADLQAELRRRYAEDASIRGGERLTPDRPGNWVRPQVTARGLYVYRYGPETFPAIVKRDLATGQETVLARASLTDDSSFSATARGEAVWFSAWTVDYRRRAETRTVSDLFVADARNGSVRRVTREAHAWHPATSADGTRLVAVQGAGPFSRLVSVDPRTGAMRVLFSMSEAGVFNPTLSPDGSRVAFILNVRGVQGLYVADVGALEAGSVPLPDPDAAVRDVSADAARAVIGPGPFGVYYPSFAGPSRILFSSDRSGALALYVADPGNGTVALVREDPVAAISGVMDGATLIYQSYATSGFCLKRATLPDEPRAPAAEPAPLPPPPPTPWTGSSVSARPYHDIPLPYLWLPGLVLRQTGPSWTDVSIGMGAWTGGGSLLAASRWQADAEWMPGPGQPSAGFTSAFDVGALEIGAASRLDYGWDGAWTESVDTSVTLDYALIGEFVRDASRLLSIGTGLRHHAQVSSTVAPFSFADSLAAPGAWSQWLAIPVTVRAQWSAGSAPADLQPSPAVDSWLQATVFPPLLSVTETQAELDLYTRLSLPSPLPHQSLRLGFKAAQDLGPAAASYTDSFTVPRGFPARVRRLPGGVLAGVDYAVPFLLDQPLILGWAVTALEIALHAEGAADVDAAAGRLSTVPALFAGVELTARFVYGTFELPVGVGVAARLAGPAPFSLDPSRDLGVYVFAGFDGFAAGARLPSAAARPAVKR